MSAKQHSPNRVRRGVRYTLMGFLAWLAIGALLSAIDAANDTDGLAVLFYLCLFSTIIVWIDSLAADQRRERRRRNYR